MSALRAGNTGKNIKVLTSSDKSDDPIVPVLDKYQINFYRGNLNNPLDRFNQALGDCDDETLVFRLTGDNVFPDGMLLDEMENYYHMNNCEYLFCNGRESNVPYGVSVELMKAKHLRLAHNNARDNYSLEHVTPYIRRNFKVTTYQFNLSPSLGNFITSIDTFEDFLFVSSVFHKFQNPISISLKELIEILPSILNLKYDLGESKFILGCAQLGMLYGITNKKGKPTNLESQKILSRCLDNNVRFFDTAMGYGDSEEVIGRFLAKNKKHDRVSLITKLLPVKSLLANIKPERYHVLITNMIQSSCFRLNTQTIDYLLFHRFEDITFKNGIVLEILKSNIEKGLIRSLGVSIQDEQELEKALKIKDIKLIQLPFNILDHRLHKYINTIREVKKKRDLIIHARSVFLQGLLLSNDHNKWKIANVKQPEKVLKSINNLVSIHKKNSLMQLCLDYVNEQDWIDGLVIGVNSEKELLENFHYFDKSSRSEKINLWDPLMLKLDSFTLNPSNWKANE